MSSVGPNVSTNRPPQYAAGSAVPPTYTSIEAAIQASRGQPFTVVNTPTGSIYLEYGRPVSAQQFQTDVGGQQYRTFQSNLQSTLAGIKDKPFATITTPYGTMYSEYGVLVDQTAFQQAQGIYEQAQVNQQVNQILLGSKSKPFEKISTPSGTVFAEYGTIVSPAKFNLDFQSANANLSVSTSSVDAAVADAERYGVFGANYLPGLGPVGQFLTGIYRAPQLAVLAGERLVQRSETGPERGTPGGFVEFSVGEVGAFSGAFLSFINPNALKVSTPEVLVAEGAGVVTSFVTGGYVFSAFEKAVGIARLGELGVIGKVAQVGSRFVYGGAVGAAESYVTGRNVVTGGVETGLIFAASPILFAGAKGVSSFVADQLAKEENSQRFLGQLAETYGFPKTGQGVRDFLKAAEYRQGESLQELEFSTERTQPYQVPGRERITGGTEGRGGTGGNRGGGGNFERDFLANIPSEQPESGYYYRPIKEEEVAPPSSGEIEIPSSTGQVQVARTQTKNVDTAVNNAIKEQDNIFDAITQTRAEAETRIRASRRGRRFESEIVFLTTPESYLGAGVVVNPIESFALGRRPVSSVFTGIGQVPEFRQTSRVSEREISRIVSDVSLLPAQVEVTTDITGLKFEQVEAQVYSTRTLQRYIQVPDIFLRRRVTKSRRRSFSEFEFIRPNQLSENILLEPGLANAASVLFGG